MLVHLRQVKSSNQHPLKPTHGPKAPLESCLPYSTCVRKLRCVTCQFPHPSAHPSARYRALNIQAGTTFCDTAFEAEVASGRLKGGTLDKYACVALAGECRLGLFALGGWVVLGGWVGT